MLSGLVKGADRITRFYHPPRRQAAIGNQKSTIPGLLLVDYDEMIRAETNPVVLAVTAIHT
ncbi:hypothetical protein N7449_005902 [Penicillium cf. viridicatum]|uniref:Uncharacterized protein n=1 Tax=Penicillium cf. viridicatum TaxID=2972119 RepID=A0A9W9MGZ8_9EURO|nr:hypothetical protein N7449_005902 [Penicillium cf. viridicatum]